MPLEDPGIAGCELGWLGRLLTLSAGKRLWRCGLHVYGERSSIYDVHRHERTGETENDPILPVLGVACVHGARDFRFRRQARICK